VSWQQECSFVNPCNLCVTSVNVPTYQNLVQEVEKTAATNL